MLTDSCVKTHFMRDVCDFAALIVNRVSHMCTSHAKVQF